MSKEVVALFSTKTPLKFVITLIPIFFFYSFSYAGADGVFDVSYQSCLRDVHNPLVNKCLKVKRVISFTQNLKFSEITAFDSKGTVVDTMYLSNTPSTYFYDFNVNMSLTTTHESNEKKSVWTSTVKSSDSIRTEVITLEDMGTYYLFSIDRRFYLEKEPNRVDFLIETLNLTKK